MAKRSSGGGGAGLLLVLVIAALASIPKETWVGIAIVAVIGFVIYLVAKATQQSPTSNPAPTAAPAPTARTEAPAPVVRVTATPSPANVDASVTADSCWVPPGTVMDIKGFGSIGGMLYYGRGLPSISSVYRLEPALINPDLRVVWPEQSQPEMPYWPSYSEITPEARGAYLRWLAAGRNDPSVSLGCVFLYFYGLERRVLADLSGQVGSPEVTPIIEEVRRLLVLYESNRSFCRYASQFLDVVETLHVSNQRLYSLAPPKAGGVRQLSLKHRVALGQAAVDGVPLPAGWALSWVQNDPRFYPRTATTRCADEFSQLFLQMYADKYGEGLRLPVNKTKLKAAYTPASGSFSGAFISLTSENLPDVAVLQGPFQQLRMMAELATADLESYSRFLGKNADGRESFDAVALLPARLWPRQTLERLNRWLAEARITGGPQATTFESLMEHFPPASALKKDNYAALATGLEQLCIGIEPDPRWGGPLPGMTAKVVLFPLAAGDQGQPSALYGVATLTLHLATALAVADGKVSAEEELHLLEHVDQWAHLGPAAHARLKAHLKWLLTTPPSLTALKKRIAALETEQRKAIASFLISLAQGDGDTTPAEMKALSKIYRLLELDEKELYGHVHAAAAEPVTVRPASHGAGSYKVPQKREAPSIALDKERIAVLTADSIKVAEMLGAIFADEEAPPAPRPEVEEVPAAESIAGLDATHSELVRVLTSRESWTRGELEDLAHDRGIMLDGAIEHINEAFLDRHDEVLLADGDPAQINKNVLKELEAA